MSSTRSRPRRPATRPTVTTSGRSLRGRRSVPLRRDPDRVRWLRPSRSPHGRVQLAGRARCACRALAGDRNGRHLQPKVGGPMPWHAHNQRARRSVTALPRLLLIPPRIAAWPLFRAAYDRWRKIDPRPPCPNPRIEGQHFCIMPGGRRSVCTSVHTTDWLAGPGVAAPERVRHETSQLSRVPRGNRTRGHLTQLWRRLKTKIGVRRSSAALC